MSFDIQIEWQEPAQARGEDLRATWARMSLLVNGKPAFNLYDRVAGSERTAIYSPALPLAEWIIENWFFLINEVGHRQGVSADFWTRHDMRHAAEGYALPLLKIMPLGDVVQVDWRQTNPKHAHVQFLGNGTELVRRQAVVEGFSRFIDAVCERLSSRGLNEHALIVEWSAICNLDDEEQEFARAAARAGLDPFSISEENSEAIIGAFNILPRQMFEDFITVNDFSSLRKQAKWASDRLKDLENLPAVINEEHLRQKRIVQNARKDSGYECGAPPHAYGRSLARIMRGELIGNSDPIFGIDGLLRIFGTDQASDVMLFEENVTDPIHALQLNKEGLRILVTRARQDSQRFAICRSIFNYIDGEGRGADIVADSYLAKDKASRAFAAELLAPAAGLKERVSDEVISVDELHELASEFEVSTQVVQHQLENHDIAQVSSTW